MDSDLIDSLVKMYQKDRSFRIVCDDFAGRERNSWHSSVDRTIQRAGLSRKEIIRVFKSLEAIANGEIGVFLAGRGSYPSRFEWNKSSQDVGKAAAGKASKIKERPADDEKLEKEEPSLVPHAFHLRADLDVELNLPADLTQGEAARLADFVKTLPLT